MGEGGGEVGSGGYHIERSFLLNACWGQLFSS